MIQNGNSNRKKTAESSVMKTLPILITFPKQLNVERKKRDATNITNAEGGKGKKQTKNTKI